MNEPDLSDEELAAVDLIGRTGARNLEVGCLDDNPDIEDWYAHAQYSGTRVTVEKHASARAALTALAERVLTGSQCFHCKGLVNLDGDAAFAYFHSTLLDGTKWDAEQAAAAGQCRWRRVGPRWVRGCET